MTHIPRLVAFGSASALTRGCLLGVIPEPDFSVYPAD